MPLVTPSPKSSILEGVTRNTVIQLAREWGIDVQERKISIDEVLFAYNEGILKEIFGTGTAAVVSPVGEIRHNDALITINGGRTGDGKLWRDQSDQRERSVWAVVCR